MCRVSITVSAFQIPLRTAVLQRAAHPTTAARATPRRIAVILGPFVTTDSVCSQRLQVASTQLDMGLLRATATQCRLLPRLPVCRRLLRRPVLL